MSKKADVVRYRSFEDDIVATAKQDFPLPADFEWVRPGRVRSCVAAVLYGFGLLCAKAYLWAALRWRIEGGGLSQKGGCVLYCNHTQPVGDALAPALVSFPARAYVVASPANLGIPVLGRLLPTLGALPLPSTLSGMRKFRAAVARRLKEGAVVAVYPEAHVWPYFTGVRPFPASSFSFAVDNKVPAWCMTTTYQRRARGERPRATVYIDGPFLPSEGLPRKAAREQLCEQVHAAMVARACASDYDYIRYERSDGEHSLLR